MKLLHALLILGAVGSTCKAHILSSSRLHYYTIELKQGSTGSAIYDLDRGIITYISKSGLHKRYNHVHMSRIAPQNATIFGTIRLHSTNELAGDWQLYKL